MAMRRVRVNIDRLVLNGFQAAEQKALVSELKSELSRILTEQSERPAPHFTPLLRLDGVPLEAGVSGSRKLGERVAAVVGKGLRR